MEKTEELGLESVSESWQIWGQILDLLLNTKLILQQKECSKTWYFPDEMLVVSLYLWSELGLEITQSCVLKIIPQCNANDKSTDANMGASSISAIGNTGNIYHCSAYLKIEALVISCGCFTSGDLA